MNRIYNTIEEWKDNWIEVKKKLFHKTLERKYGKSFNDSIMLINDRELSNITGSVRFKIKIKSNDE